ncbi:RND family efflux transporter MFP subunit, putative [Babesia caballi]|uniref:RND family efflux transporter MFP subunit, putative n=1 Tax=Babesia caballi TaxID=5871 RepID=A0AAV4LNP0_BABCB|nr:RND family efflux transporter MFP subunit, putative [Babesia caballi]
MLCPAPITWKDLKSGPTHIDTEGCSTNGVEAIVEGSECAKAATDNKTVPTALAKERCDVGVQKFDVETKADTIDPDTTQNPSNGLYDVVLGQKAALSDIGEKVTAISGKLEELYTAFERLESAQNAILKRVSRRSLYNQFLID